jgi:uncharacterized membrane protein YdjX (TVP38/TMEM64 family)
MGDGQDTSPRDVAGGPLPCASPPRRRRLWAVLRQLGPASILSAVALVSPFAGGLLILGMIQQLAPWLHGHGGGGAMVYIAGYWILGGLALLPTYTHSALGGWAFGFKSGLAAALLSFAGASLVAYAISRRAAGERVIQLIAEHPKWQAVYDALLKSGFWRSLFIVTLVRVPVAPFAMTNVIMASARVPLGAFVFGTFLGLLPQTAFVVYTAAKAEKLDFGESNELAVFLVSMALAGLAVCLIAYLAKRTLDRVTREHGKAQ